MKFKFTFLARINGDVRIKFSNEDVPEGQWDLVCDAAHTAASAIAHELGVDERHNLLVTGELDSETRRFTTVNVTHAAEYADIERFVPAGETLEQFLGE